MDIFENLFPEELEQIAHILRERYLSEGEVLCREGEVGDAMYLVTGGRIRLSTTDPSGNEKILAHFTDGQFFGEMSLITGAPRTATATAEAESRVLLLEKRDCDELLSTHPQVMREMLRVISQRTIQTRQALLADDGSSSASVGPGKVVAFFSPRGGAGTTTLALNTAVALQEPLPERVALLDLNLVFGHVALLLNLTPERSLASLPTEALENLDRRTLATYLIAHRSGLQVLAGALRPEEGESVTGEHVRAALAAMRRQFVLTLVDCSTAFDDPTIAALEAADRVVLVCTPELNTLRDIRECQRVLSDVLHFDRSRVIYVLNHHQPFRVLARTQFEEHLEQTMALEIPHAGEAAMKAAMKGEPLFLLHRGSAFSRTLERFAADLVPPEARSARAKTGKATVASSVAPEAAVQPRGILARLRRS